MSMYFSLQNLCDFDITRPVCDMAAFFDYELASDDQHSLLRVSYEIEEHRVTATFYSGLHIWICAQKCDLNNGLEPSSGEITRCIKLAVVDVFKNATELYPAMPWGILTGVRPGKLAHKLLDAGHSANKLPEYLEQAYLLPRNQGSLLTDIAVKQKRILPDMTDRQYQVCHSTQPF